MKAQVTLTVPAAKEVIAGALVLQPAVRAAHQHGRILLKGGTTVSAVARRFGYGDLRLSGRISPNGTKGAGETDTSIPHSIMIQNGKWQNIDEDFAGAVTEMHEHDVAIIGANAIDIYGHAGLLLGSPNGGNPGKGLSGLAVQGCHVFIACGLEKLIPGDIFTAAKHAGRCGTDWSMGMSCGLVPLIGDLFTEKRALEKTFGLHVYPIAAGGIHGAEGAGTYILEGDRSDVIRAVQFILDCRKRAKEHQAVYTECLGANPSCRNHQQCAWRTAKGGDLSCPIK